MEILAKVSVGILITALIIIGTMVICLVIGNIWSYIQDCLYNEWGFQLPPKKSYWDCKWMNTGEVTKDVVPQKIMECEHCSYKTIIRSRCCPACGRYMKNWDPEWNRREMMGVITRM